jgi:hypothetical protein
MTGIVLVVLLLGLSTATATDTVTRTLPETAFPNDTITVSLTIDFDNQTAVDRLVITETVPAEWEIVDASNSGILAAPGKISWIIIEVLGGTIPPDGAVFTYHVTVPSDASGTCPFSGIYGTNTAGTNLNVLGAEKITVSTGGDTTSPTVTANTPTGTGVSVSTVITVTFSEAMNHASAEGAFSIAPPVAGSFSWSGDMMVFTPDADLECNTTHHVTIGTGAMDLAGNSLEAPFIWEFATAPPPTVTANTPTGAGVSVSTAITVTFSEAMNQASAESAFSIASPVAGSFIWYGDMMVFTPDANLAYGTTYEVTIGTGAMDLAGNPLEDPFIWEFTTVPEPDTTPPTVTTNTPTGTGVSVSTVITVTFSKAMNQASAEGAFSIAPPVTGSFSWSGDMMIFDPDTNLAYGTTYAVTIGTGAMDLAGNSLGDPFNWDFTTASEEAPEQDITPPTVTTNAPTGAGVSVPTVISVAFDEVMNHASAEGAFSINPDVDGSFSWSGTTMIFDPDTNLAYDTTYAVTIGTGAMDLAGNSLGDPFIWDFTTESAPAPTIASGDPASPVSDIAGAARRFSITIDQTVNVTWLINGTQVQLNVSVTDASYTNTSAVPGCWNVSAVAENENGTDMQTWIWDVAETTGVSVTGKTNFTAASDDANVTGNFSNPLSGWINVTDTGDDPTASPDVNDSTLRAGLGDPDIFVSSVYIDVSLSNIEDEMAAGNGSMRIELHYTDAELVALGIDENTLDIYKFGSWSELSLIASIAAETRLRTTYMLK